MHSLILLQGKIMLMMQLTLQRQINICASYFLQVHDIANEMSNFLTDEPDLWPYDLDLKIIPFDPHAKIQVCMSVRLAISVWQMDRWMDGQTHRQVDWQFKKSQFPSRGDQ